MDVCIKSLSVCQAAATLHRRTGAGYRENGVTIDPELVSFFFQ